MTTELYDRTMQFADAEEDRERGELLRKVWAQTPWMVDAYTGGCGNERSREMQWWCRDQFGPECWPIHGHPGTWQRGGVTMSGWTWYGFASEEQMQQFLARWPEPDNTQAKPTREAGSA